MGRVSYMHGPIVLGLTGTCFHCYCCHATELIFEIYLELDICDEIIYVYSKK